MRIAVTGGTGFIGRALVNALSARDHEVLVLSRHAHLDGLPLGGGRVRVVRGDPQRPGPWQAELGDVDAAIHLAGENVVGRWTEAKKRSISESRKEGTHHVVDALLAGRARCLVSASAIGYYGPHGDETLDESAPAGSDFLADVCRTWEAEAERFSGASRRLVIVRTGVVLGPDGGTLGKMLPAFRAFVGGPIGDGQQWISWIHLADQVALLEWALDDPRVAGAIDATAPNPTRMEELAQTIGRLLGRPSNLPVPALAVRLLFGEAASVLLTGQRVLPRRALDSGFAFRYPTLEGALENLLHGGRN